MGQSGGSGRVNVVLIGGGHSHVAVLKAFGMRPAPGVRLTLVSPDSHTPYSGMLPGLVAGHYAFDDAHIDLRRLCRFAGAHFLRDEAVGLDLAARRVLCSGRPPLRYDVLSLDIGSAPRTGDVPGAAENAIPVKPISRFLERWRDLGERMARGGGKGTIAVVGGGAGGVELLLAVQYRLARLLAERGCAAEPAFHLFTESDDILPSHALGVRAAFRRVFAARGVSIHAGAAVTEVGSGHLTTRGGAVIAADEILWVTAAGAAAWPGEAGLAVDAQGFVLVDDRLQSVSHPGVFAAGDVAAIADHPRPKAGVFAVRQGPVLARNIRHAALGEPLESFRPQRRFLSLITTGDKYAVASYGGWALEGPALWRLKEWIDRRFMAKYADLPAMKAAGSTTPPGDAMRCGGCGAKLAEGPLRRALARLRPSARADVLVGLDPPDDAAVVAVPAGKLSVQTVDFFRAFVDDPYVFGQVAANHCLGDIFAMGAEPSTALAIATVPYGPEAEVEEQFYQGLAGALGVLEEAGAVLVGGHSGEGAEFALGFAVTGLAESGRLWRKGGLRPGDRLLLTKPLGTGTLLAADMRGRAKGRWIDAALISMLQSSRPAAQCLRRHGATACTDVTGFGLLGHLGEMLRASEADAILDLDVVPVLAGAVETLGRGIASTLQPENERFATLLATREFAADERFPLLFDPQTAGGLLVGVPAARAAACVEELRGLGYEQAALIGEVIPRGAGDPAVVLRWGEANAGSARTLGAGRC